MSEDAVEPARFVNRELSWLEFNQRVLDEAIDPSVPLLERLKFLAITSSNLDEFFMVRVGGLQLLDRMGSKRRDPAGMTAAEQLSAVSGRVHRMVEAQYACFLEQLEPALSAAGIRWRHGADLSERQLAAMRRFFESEVYSVLTAMAVEAGPRFPLLVNQTLNLLVRLPDPGDDGSDRFAVIPLGRTLPRFITLPSDGGFTCILLEDAVAMFIERFFPGRQIRECIPFRITRNADLTVQEDMAADLLAEMEELLEARKESDCVRLEIPDAASAEASGFLQRALEVDEEHVYRAPGPLDLANWMQLTGLGGFDELRYPPWPPQPARQVDPKASMFDVLAGRDVLLYHPFDSFEPVVRLLEEAAEDPDVLAIKQVLYRTSRGSRIVAALKRAAEHGKHVTAVVELKARFDEARNIEWARDLEREGVQVIYGVKGFKIHAKVLVVVRREPQGIRRYVHYGTGNYNESTARLYTDASLLSSNDDLGADATAFFNAVNGYSQLQQYRRIEMAPVGMRDRLLELIDSEIQFARQGQHAHIRAKFNSLADPAIMDALYQASAAGVTIELNVRGICCLRPGVPGLSENISVVSIIDRFLEHSRIFFFHHGGDRLVFIASADWMPRNLDRRLELMVPVEEPRARDRLLHILETCLRDTVKGRRILGDGGYERLEPSGPDAMASQEQLYREACEAVKRAQDMRQRVFEPHRAP